MYFTIEPLFPGLTRIWDVSHTAIYLAEGEERALLIDTGVGVGDLKSVVESLTDKPLTVFVTHGHVDHAMGAIQFENVHISPLDRQVYGTHSDFAGRKGYVAGASKMGGSSSMIASVADEDYLTVADFEQFKPLSSGDSVDLGGVTAQVLSGAGHTQGMITVLFPQWRVLLLGDACNSFTFLFEECSSSVTVYREMLLGLKAQTDGRYDRVLFSHGNGEGALDMIDQVIAVCDDILTGQTDDIPFRGFNGDECFVAKAMDFSRFCRVDGGAGNIVYNKSKLV